MSQNILPELLQYFTGMLTPKVGDSYSLYLVFDVLFCLPQQISLAYHLYLTYYLNEFIELVICRGRALICLLLEGLVSLPNILLFKLKLLSWSESGKRLLHGLALLQKTDELPFKIHHFCLFIFLLLFCVTREVFFGFINVWIVDRVIFIRV